MARPTFKINKCPYWPEKIMNTQPLFTPVDAGFSCSPVGTILLCAFIAHGPSDRSTPQAVANALVVIDGILSAAYRGGFRNGDIVRTMLPHPENHNERLAEMLAAACSAAGDNAIRDVFARARIGTWLR
jgi:hypothetical protein